MAKKKTTKRKKARSAAQKRNDRKLGRMAKARAAGKKIKSKVKRKTNKVTKRKRSMPRKGLKGITSSSTLKKVALGVGGATMAAALLSFVAPNSNLGRFAPAAGAYALGGLEGVIGNFALGMIGNRSTSNANVAPQMEVL